MMLLFSVTMHFYCPIPSSQSCARHLNEQVRQEMSEVPAGWVGPLIQQLSTATFDILATATCHKVTAVVVATLLPRGGSRVSFSLRGRTAENRSFWHSHRKRQCSDLPGWLILKQSWKRGVNISSHLSSKVRHNITVGSWTRARK